MLVTPPASATQRSIRRRQIAEDAVHGVGSTAHAEFGGEVEDFRCSVRDGSFVLQEFLHALVELPPVHRLQVVLLLGAAVGDDLLLHVQQHQRLPERQPFFGSEPGQGRRDRNLGTAAPRWPSRSSGKSRETLKARAMSSRFVGADAPLAVLQVRQKTLGNPGLLAQLVLRPAEFQPTFLDSLAYACHSLLLVRGNPNPLEIRRGNSLRPRTADFQPAAILTSCFANYSVNRDDELAGKSRGPFRGNLR